MTRDEPIESQTLPALAITLCGSRDERRLRLTNVQMQCLCAANAANASNGNRARFDATDAIDAIDAAEQNEAIDELLTADCHHVRSTGR